MTGDSQSVSPGTGADTTGNRWSQLKALFDSALALDPSERNSFIERQCGNNQELRQELESLLRSYEESGDFFEPPFGDLSFFADTTFPGDALPEPQIGSRIGAYCLEREIGRGGMGAVYLATRADSEFVKRVAIKLIRSGKDNDFAIGRFRNERQILARLEHPFVARLIDGGSRPTQDCRIS